MSQMSGKETPPMSPEQNSPDKVHQRPETWNDDHALRAETVIPAPEHRDDKHETSRFSLKQRVGATVAALLVAGGAALGVSKALGGESVDAAPRQPETSAPAEPSTPKPVESASAEPTASNPVETAPAQPEVITDEYVESVNRDPSPEVIEYSLQPVSTKEFTEEQALDRLMNDLKIYWLSGEFSENTGSTELYSPESVKLGERQFENIFGPESYRDEDRLSVGWVQRTRNNLTDSIDFLTVEMGYPKNATFNSSFSVLSAEEGLLNETFYTIRNEWRSTATKVNYTFNTHDTDKPSHTVDRVIGIGQHNGNYHISYIGYADPADAVELQHQ